MTPVFIISLPRSGSTLLQRILFMSADVHTTSEPWIAIPSLYALKKTQVLSEYNHYELGKAVNYFIQQFPEKIHDYYKATNAYLCSMYELASNGERYFVDKTPRYALVVHELAKVFPNAKFIVLWRNPLSVMASMIQTWGKGRWNVFRYTKDLYDGVYNMVSFAQEHPECITVQYEELAADPDGTMKKVWEYLKIDPVPLDGKNIPVGASMKGCMGDTTGIKKYTQVSSKSVNAWQKTICNLSRVLFCKRYLKTIGDERLAAMGYNAQELREQLNKCPAWSRSLVADIFWMLLGAAYTTICNFFLQYSYKRNKEA